MEDVVLISGVLYLRPSVEGNGEAILCDGVIEFRNPAGRKKEEAIISERGRKTFPSQQEGDESIIEFVPPADDEVIADDGGMG